jgi:hypothetical protein
MARRTEQLFARMQAIYGGRWLTCYGTPQAIDLAIAEWAEVVERMGDAQLRTAITWAKTMCPWPPSIAEFLHAGLGIDEDAIKTRCLSFLSYWDRTHMTKWEIDNAVRFLRHKALEDLVSHRLLPAIEEKSNALP